MTTWPSVFLGLIALATVTMALIQVGAIIYAGRLARRVDRLTQQVEREIQPMLGQLAAMTGDATRVASMAVAQAERLDGLLTDMTAQMEQGVAQIRQAVISPARNGFAIISGVRAAISALRGLDIRQRSGRPEDEDALFIG